MTVQAVSKHLKVLEDADLVSRRRDAQRRPVHLEAEVFDLMTRGIERSRRQAEERLPSPHRGGRMADGGATEQTDLPDRCSICERRSTAGSMKR